LIFDNYEDIETNDEEKELYDGFFNEFMAIKGEVKSRIIITSRREGAGTAPIRIKPLDRSEITVLLEKRISYLIKEEGIKPKNAKLITELENYLQPINKQYAGMAESSSSDVLGHPLMVFYISLRIVNGANPDEVLTEVTSDSPELKNLRDYVLVKSIGYLDEELRESLPDLASLDRTFNESQVQQWYVNHKEMGALTFARAREFIRELKAIGMIVFAEVNDKGEESFMFTAMSSSLITPTPNIPQKVDSSPAPIVSNVYNEDEEAVCMFENFLTAPQKFAGSVYSEFNHLGRLAKINIRKRRIEEHYRRAMAGMMSIITEPDDSPHYVYYFPLIDSMKEMLGEFQLGLFKLRIDAKDPTLVLTLLHEMYTTGVLDEETLLEKNSTSLECLKDCKLSFDTQFTELLLRTLTIWFTSANPSEWEFAKLDKANTTNLISWNHLWWHLKLSNNNPVSIQFPAAWVSLLILENSLLPTLRYQVQEALMETNDFVVDEDFQHRCIPLLQTDDIYSFDELSRMISSGKYPQEGDRCCLPVNKGESLNRKTDGNWQSTIKFVTQDQNSYEVIIEGLKVPEDDFSDESINYEVYFSRSLSFRAFCVLIRDSNGQLVEEEHSVQDDTPSEKEARQIIKEILRDIILESEVIKLANLGNQCRAKIESNPEISLGYRALIVRCNFLNPKLGDFLKELFPDELTYWGNNEFKRCSFSADSLGESSYQSFNPFKSTYLDEEGEEGGEEDVEDQLVDTLDAIPFSKLELPPDSEVIQRIVSILVQSSNQIPQPWRALRQLYRTSVGLNSKVANRIGVILTTHFGDEIDDCPSRTFTSAELLSVLQSGYTERLEGMDIDYLIPKLNEYFDFS
jgi:hypothetical protein